MVVCVRPARAWVELTPLLCSQDSDGSGKLSHRELAQGLSLLCEHDRYITAAGSNSSLCSTNLLVVRNTNESKHEVEYLPVYHTFFNAVVRVLKMMVDSCTYRSPPAPPHVMLKLYFRPAPTPPLARALPSTALSFGLGCRLMKHLL